MVYKVLWVVSFPRRTAGPNIVGSYCVPVSHESGVRGVVGEAETAEF